MRAFCVSGVLFHISHLKLHFALHISHCILHTPHSTLHTSHSTLHTSHSKLHTSHSTLHSPHFSLLSSHSTLHTSLFMPHTSHCTLHTPRFISSEIFSPYPSSSLLISSLPICHLNFHESLPSTTTKVSCSAMQHSCSHSNAICNHRFQNNYKTTRAHTSTPKAA